MASSLPPVIYELVGPEGRPFTMADLLTGVGEEIHVKIEKLVVEQGITTVTLKVAWIG